ncbi:hypothetical protein LWE61_13060 [Sphingobium sufflavum]|uniref:hypothetical protein n=1 Tax=Sphingobium sufflavum TaxID=1129547 RepID=UPI001F41DF6D|nr:hypothetical protein [Sphingobium sufflavum]MCE7797481.1 hypothetical protein [Sphingobium sufflavum]
MRTTHDAVRQMAVAMLLILPACGGPVPGAGNDAQPVAGGNAAADALEALATESGVIGEDGSVEPVGSYGRAYDGGEDRLCVLPSGGEAKSYRFGVEIRIGEEEYCRGSGKASRAGDLLILRFDGGRCTVTARYDGDRIAMPGAVDRGCASLCSARGSFAGVSFPRIGMDRAAADGVMANDGAALCGG